MRERLSPREIQIFQLIMAGKTDWEIAVILGISPKTVNYHVERAKQSLGAVSRTQAIFVALRHALMPLPQGFAIEPMSAPAAVRRPLTEQPDVLLAPSRMVDLARQHRPVACANSALH